MNDWSLLPLLESPGPFLTFGAFLGQLEEFVLAWVVQDSIWRKGP